MNGKIVKAKPKMADVTKPRKSTSADPGSEQLIIQSRPIISHVTSLGSSSDDDPSKNDEAAQPETPSAPTLPSQTKRTLIVPISDGATKEATPEPAASEEPKVELTAAASKAAVTDIPKPEAAEETPKTTAAKPTKETEEAADEDATPEEPGTDKADKKDGKASAETQKAIAEAAAAAKRDHELEALIDSKQFYVPVNAVARKREVKHSALMTIAVLLLALILIDLMLDSGLILLAERIPHTHFFTTSSIDQK